MTPIVTDRLHRLPRWIFIPAALTLLGLVVGIYRLAVGLAPTTNLSHAYPWGLWIGFDLFMVAFSGGAFTLAALVYILDLHEFHPAVRPTILTGLLGYMSVLAILAVDLGRWDRFYHFVIYPNINSALFEVSWCILLYTTVLVAEFSPVVLGRFGWHRVVGWIRRITIPLVIVGVTLSTLHQSSLGTLFIIMSQRLHALWYTPMIPLFFFISSLAAGLAMVIGGATVSWWVFHRSLKQNLVAQLGGFVPWVLGLYFILKLGDLFVAGELPLLAAGDRYSFLFLAELGIGVVLPLFLFASPRVRSSRPLSLAASILVLAGIFINRFNATWWALTPVEGYSYVPHWMEIAIQAGVIAGVIVVYTLVGFYFPLFEGTERRASTEALPAVPGQASGTPA